VDRYLQLVEELKLRRVEVVDTHLHADHITGSAPCATEPIAVMSEPHRRCGVALVTDWEKDFDVPQQS